MNKEWSELNKTMQAQNKKQDLSDCNSVVDTLQAVDGR